MFSIIMGILGCIYLLICVMGIIGACITCKIDCDLIEAIGKYKRKCIREKEWYKFMLVNLDDIYEFNIIQDCFPWLWRYKKRLPAEKYELIEPYLKTSKSVGGVGGFDFYHGVYRDHEEE